MRQRTQLINALRAHMAELGIVAAQGREGVKELLKIIASEEDERGASSEVSSRSLSNSLLDSLAARAEWQEIVRENV